MRNKDEVGADTGVAAEFITAMLCSVEIEEGRRFKFCVPSGCPFDFDEMQERAKDAGVTDIQWANLMDKIEGVFESLQ